MHKGIVAFVIFTVLILTLACATESPVLTSTPVTAPTATPANVVEPPATRSSSSVNSMVISSIETNREVVEAAISQRGDQVSLVLIVRSATNKQRAQELGDNFVRMFKSLSPDTVPGRVIGEGIYDYLVGVYYPNEKQLASGAKAKNARRITW